MQISEFDDAYDDDTSAREREEQMLGETEEVQGWLKQREQAASIESLYGK